MPVASGAVVAQLLLAASLYSDWLQQHGQFRESGMAESLPFRPVDRVDRAGRTLGSGQLAAMVPEPAGARPAYRHLAQAISALILDGRIALHVRLPAERELAAALKTSRPTITAAYDLLRESGYAHSRQGAGTWTALPEGTTTSGVTRVLAPPDTAINL